MLTAAARCLVTTQKLLWCCTKSQLCSSGPFLCLAFDTQLGSHGTLGCGGGGGLRPLPSIGQPQILGLAACVSPDCPSCNHISEVSIRCIALSIHSGEAWHQPSFFQHSCKMELNKSFRVGNNNNLLCFYCVCCVFAPSKGHEGKKSWRGDELIIILHFWYPGISLAGMEALLCATVRLQCVCNLKAFATPAMHRIIKSTGPCGHRQIHVRPA